VNLCFKKSVHESYASEPQKERWVVQGYLFTIFLLTFYAFKFPDHYGLISHIDASYLLICLILYCGVIKRTKIPRDYLKFSFIFLCCSIYCILFSILIGEQSLNSFNEFLEGDTYYSRPIYSWATSIISQAIFLCVLPPFFCSIPKRSQIFALRIFLFVNAYFAFFQVFSVLDLRLLDFLPVHIGVNTSDGFNLSFGRAVGLTAAHGAFYYSFGALSALLILVSLDKLRWFDVVIALFSALSLSRSAIIALIFFILFVMLFKKTRLLNFIIVIALISILAWALFNSSLWELRMLDDKSGEIRSGQIGKALEALFDNPFGIGGQHLYFFDSSLTAILVEYGLIGVIGQILIIYMAYRILKGKFSFIQSSILIFMSIISLALIGSPFAYLPTLFIGMFLYHTSTQGLGTQIYEVK
jgi:hypothetical protein